MYPPAGDYSASSYPHLYAHSPAEAPAAAYASAPPYSSGGGAYPPYPQAPEPPAPSTLQPQFAPAPAPFYTPSPIRTSTPNPPYAPTESSYDGSSNSPPFDPTKGQFYGDSSYQSSVPDQKGSFYGDSSFPQYHAPTNEPRAYANSRVEPPSYSGVRMEQRGGFYGDNFYPNTGLEQNRAVFGDSSFPAGNPDQRGGYFSDITYAGARVGQKKSYVGDSFSQYGASYDRSRTTLEQELYGKKPESTYGSGYSKDSTGEGIYAYDGGQSEPYGARGTAPTRSATLFDDYGRSINSPSLGAKNPAPAKVVRAVPKVDTSEDVRNGVQKFRVKLLPEGAGSNMDVLCQIGLDGIRMLDPSTNRTLRIYPLENVTRWEVLDSSIFAFWSKSSSDAEPRRIRMKSNSYTTSTILDTVTAATVQFKEIGGSSITRSKSDVGNASEQQSEKKKGLIDWGNLMKPLNEEKDHWVPDEAASKCTGCGTDFTAFVRRHHCRNCGDIFCDKCTKGRTALTAEENAAVVRVCDRCMDEVTRRLSIAKDTSFKPIVHSHEDLAKRIQEAMDLNRKATSASQSSSVSGRRMKEVACPVCTVHLQVQVPSSGSQTIECGVCQHPFVVTAR